MFHRRGSRTTRQHWRGCRCRCRGMRSLCNCMCRRIERHCRHNVLSANAWHVDYVDEGVNRVVCEPYFISEATNIRTTSGLRLLVLNRFQGHWTISFIKCRKLLFMSLFWFFCFLTHSLELYTRNPKIIQENGSLCHPLIATVDSHSTVFAGWCQCGSV